MQKEDSYKTDLERMKQDPNYKESVFLHVFQSQEGKNVLDYLSELFNYPFPNVDNVNDTFFCLGRRNAIETIKQILKGGKEK